MTPAISSEVLSGHPFQGGHESDAYATRLHQIALQARILISIRSQMRILPSVYMQYVLLGGTMRPDQFFAGTDRPGYFGFTPRNFEYDLFVAHYQRLFGSQNVYVMTQESLRENSDTATAALANFIGNDQFSGLSLADKKPYAPSYPEYSLPVLRRINHVQSSTLNPNPIVSLGQTPHGLYRGVGYVLRRPPFSTFFKSYKPLSTYVQAQFGNYYEQSNARLDALTASSLNLSQYT